jgi:hypothetical protein
MNRRSLFTAGAAAALAATFAACAAEKSSNPLTPTLQGPIPGVNISAPAPVAPVNGQRMRSDQQPLTLTVANASTSSVRPLGYVFEVAADAGFTTMVYTSGRVGAGDNGQTTLRLPDALAADRPYHWRARGDDGANTGPNSEAANFNVFTPVVFQPPTPLEPVNDNTVQSLRPKFSFKNAERTGSPDVVQYTVEVSDSGNFAVSVSAVVPETPDRTSITPPQDLPLNKKLYWHVRAFDSIMTGPWSPTATFNTAQRAQGGADGCGYPGHPSTCSTALWHDCFFGLLKSHNIGPTVSFEALTILRGELLVMGADWQNGWRGDYRPRIFLPVPNCPGPTANAPDCSYSRTVDIGDFGSTWQWIPR